MQNKEAPKNNAETAKPTFEQLKTHLDAHLKKRADLLKQARSFKDKGASVKEIEAMVTSQMSVETHRKDAYATAKQLETAKNLTAEQIKDVLNTTVDFDPKKVDTELGQALGPAYVHSYQEVHKQNDAVVAKLTIGGYKVADYPAGFDQWFAKNAKDAESFEKHVKKYQSDATPVKAALTREQVMNETLIIYAPKNAIKGDAFTDLLNRDEVLRPLTGLESRIQEEREQFKKKDKEDEQGELQDLESILEV